NCAAPRSCNRGLDRRIDKPEGADRNGVVPLSRLDVKRSRMTEDGEAVVTLTPDYTHLEARAAAEPAIRGQLRSELIVAGDAFKRPARSVRIEPGRSEQLADLEQIVALAAIERGDSQVVVADEGVVAAPATHSQASIDRRRIVDPLDGLGACGQIGDRFTDTTV